MNKYQKVMQHVRVDDEMKKRILQNVEKELSKEGTVKAPGMADKIVPFGKRLGDGVKRYAGIAAMFAVLLVGAAVVVKMTGGVSNMSTSPMSDTAMEAPAATEAPAYEEAAEATYDSDSMAEEAIATQEAESEPVGSTEKAEGANAPAATQEPATSVEEGAEQAGTVSTPQTEAEPESVSWAHYIAPILLPVILLVVIILIIWLIVCFVRRRK